MKTYQIKDAQGNVVEEIDLDESDAPYTIVEKSEGGDIGGGGGPVEVA